MASTSYAGLGITGIESDRRKLLRAIEKASASFSSQVPGWSVDTAVRSLQDLSFLFRHTFAKEHFVMRLALYPLLEPHRAEHRLFLDEFNAMFSGRRLGRKGFDGVLSFALKFITAHGADADRRLVAFLEESRGDRLPLLIPVALSSGRDEYPA